MIATPRLRKLLLSAHLTVSVGWIGALAAYLALDVTSVTSRDPTTLRAAYVSMELIAQRVIVPLAIASLLTGIVMSVTTRWGLLRHYWVLFSLLLTVLATVVLLLEARTISAYAALAAELSNSGDEIRGLGSTLVHSVGGAVILVVVLVLNVYKPRGLTPYGWRRQGEQRRP